MDDNARAMDTDTDGRGARDAALVRRIRDGEPDAFGELYDLWYDRVHDLAFRVTRDSAAAGDVTQDAFLAAWQQLAGLDRPEVFGGWLLRIARNRALDHLRRTSRSTPGDPETMAMIERTGPSPASAPSGFRVEDRVAAADDPMRAAEDDEITALVWGAAQALGERDSEVLDLTLRHGMSPAEIAEVVGTNRNAANQMVHRARNRLKDAVCARVLWKRGRPECGDLADALADAGVQGFGADAVRVTSAHVATCELCSERQQLRLDPTRIFAAIPVVAAPVVLKQRTAHALMAEGVPLGRSRAVAPGPDGTHARGRGRGRRALLVGAAGVVALVIALVAVVVLADRLDRGTVDGNVVARSRTTTTAAPSTSTTTTTTLPVLVIPPPAEEPGAASEPAGEPAPPVDGGGDPVEPPAPPAGSVRLSIAPATTPPTWLRSDGPVLSWSSEGATTVDVSGPGVAASGASGSMPLCPSPTGPQWSFCSVPPGTYTYTATARDATGTIVAVASMSLTVT